MSAAGTAIFASMRSGRYTFHAVTYDPPSDVLHARVSSAEVASHERTQEGDYWGYDADGRPATLTVYEPRRRLERDGAVRITLPSGELERLQGVEAAMRSPVADR
jgi:hypothetical protein